MDTEEPKMMDSSIKEGWFMVVRVGEIDGGPKKKSIDLYSGRCDSIYIDPQIEMGFGKAVFK